MTDIAYAGTAQAAAPARTGRRLRRRHLWLIPGLAIAVFGNELGKAHDVGILSLIAFGITPDLPRLLRYLGKRPASVATRISNLLHHPLVAFAAFAVAAAGAANDLIPVVVLVATVIWVSHIVIGWAVGDGIREVAR
ncbi:MAG TPA: hypothetical protein VJ850_04055 [Candidatus Limnocylindrales bacterium]|nr:hypothetical protein [Candidatus Limnocylindrales bacterium]